MSDTAKQRQCLNDLNKRYGNQPEAGEYVVESYLKLALLAEKGGDKNATNRAYQKVRDEFMQPAACPRPRPAAAAAAKAEFLLVEEKFNAFKAKPLKLTYGPQGQGDHRQTSSPTPRTCRRSTSGSGTTRTPPGPRPPSCAGATSSTSSARS